MKAISIFSGSMGLDIGLEAAGIEVTLGVDVDLAAANTARFNRPNLPFLCADVSELSGHQLLKASGHSAVDLLVGGPPCQAFSVYGKRRGVSDARGQVIFQYIRLLKEISPRYFVMENVRGLLSMSLPGDKSHGALLRLIVSDLNQLGYHVDLYVVNSANYGAPQIRERIILIGNNVGMKSVFPAPTHSNRPEDQLIPFRTLGDALEKLIDPTCEIMDFSPRKKKYLSLVPPGGNWRMLDIETQKESMGKAWGLTGGRSAYWRKLTFEFPCPTVVTMPNHAGTSMCHPTELRPLSVAECARVQEFPDDWCFVGSTADKYRLIGNAVPVRLGQIVGQAVLALSDAVSSSEARSELRASPSYTETHLRPHVRTRSYFKNGSATTPISYYDESITQFQGRLAI